MPVVIDSQEDEVVVWLVMCSVQSWQSITVNESLFTIKAVSIVELEEDYLMEHHLVKILQGDMQ